MKMMYECETDEEFKEWLEETINHGNPTEEERECMRSFYEAEWNFRKAFEPWAKEYLAPEVQKLADMAKGHPQYDYRYLYILEQQKLVCMRTYFSHCRFTPEAIARRNRWINICIRLLSYLTDEGQIIKREQIRRMNTLNLKGLIRTKELDGFLALPKNGKCRTLKAEEFYKRKIARLYHLIRLHKSHEWWE